LLKALGVGDKGSQGSRWPVTRAYESQRYADQSEGRIVASVGPALAADFDQCRQNLVSIAARR